MKKHIILFIAIFFASVLHAQTINIRGTVTDTSNETLPGVSITIKGTQTGTVSDANGNYSIRAQRGNVLEFTFVESKMSLIYKWQQTPLIWTK